jgi:hypothetical protein
MKKMMKPNLMMMKMMNLKKMTKLNLMKMKKMMKLKPFLKSTKNPKVVMMVITLQTPKPK